METFKTQLVRVLGHFLYLTLLEQGGWTTSPSEVPSNLSGSVVL